ncbi:MAG: cyclic pyranopterin monophosphate synthase MoaC [Thermoplasmata archaeon]|nr:cyclic pyranopterin monophosphate synthase MoaC [Thermoplasmata archaeon]
MSPTARQRAISAKPIVFRRAVAKGVLTLRPRTLRAIRKRTVAKGDALHTGEIAGLLAMKRTAELIPHCHPLPVTGSSVDLTVRPRSVRVTVAVESVGRTGVEMEALVGASVALLTVWDMVKYLEKNAKGLYPNARIDGLRVTQKVKRALPRGR